MGAYKYIAKTFAKEYKERSKSLREKITEWKAQPVVVRVEKPTNITRARTLGYKAKQGYIIARVRVRKGRRKRPKQAKGRKPGTNIRFITRDQSLKLIGEVRASKRFTNMEVLNSYYVGEEGNYKFFEVILIDPSKATVTIAAKNSRGRVQRGLTHEGKTARGLL